MATVTLNQGKLKGGKAVSDNGTTYYEFLGVPYAKPPVGDLRFKSPQPVEPWVGERDATAVSQDNVCCQMDFIKGNAVGSEDCLYLNVYTPKLPESGSKPLPVMVFIHGGGFLYTNGIIKQDMGPDYLIEHDVVVITFNYRLGVLGFLSLGVPEASGNVGLKDQIFVLKWVQENIDKFGGDRDNVTLFGLSAGSASVDYLLLSPLCKGLFHKAILQSGSSLNHWAMNYDPRKLVLKLLEKMGYSGSTNNNREIHDFLLASSASLLIEASNKAIEDPAINRMYFGFVPTIEKDFGNGEAVITDCPYKLLNEGKFNKVPIIKGFCNKEGYLMNMLKPQAVLDLMKNKNFIEHLSYTIDESDRNYFDASILSAYSENIKPDDDDDALAVNFYSDLDFVAGAWISGQIMASQGLPVYFYEFSYDGNMNFCKKLFGLMRKGAAHGDDFAYAFKHSVSQSCEGKDQEIRKSLCLILTDFAKTSIPDAGLDVEWPKYTSETPAYLSIDQDITIKYNFEPKKMAVFKEIYDKYLK